MADVLEVENLHAGYGRNLSIIHGIDFRVDSSKTLAVLGPNGSGKSTLLKSIFGLTHIHQGSIVFRGRDIGRIPSYKIPKLGLAYVPQQDAVFGGLTVKENLAVGAIGSGKRTSRRIEEILDAMATLQNRLQTKAGALSGGEQRLVAIARALMSNPTVLLLDEPTAGLAPKAGAEVLEQIDELQLRLGIGVLLVEQNARAAIEVADHVLVLAAGLIAFSGSKREAVADSDLAALYLGRPT